MIALLIIAVIAVILVVAVVVIYNNLVQLNERVNEAFSDITVQLKYRADLVPNLVETVKGYAKHEKTAFENVTKARAAVMGAKDLHATEQAEKTLEGALSKIFAIAEAYPDLKASTNFQELQQQLQDTEDKIQAARRFYNNGVKELNTQIKTIPTNWVNSMFAHFKEREYYEVDDAERKKIQNAPEVKF